MVADIQRSVKVAGFVLPVRDGRLLLARHSYGPPVWAMVGGMAEAGETPDAAARREALEECGLTVSTDSLRAVCDLGHLLLFVYSSRVLDGEGSPQDAEIAELRWFRPGELDGEASYDVIRRLWPPASAPAGGTAGLTRQDVGWPDGAMYPVFAG